MLQIPPFPTWDSLHPLIIHFPVVLLLLSPLFILISVMLDPPKGKPYMTAALLIVILGTGSLFIADSTGHTASELVKRGGATETLLNMHEDLASRTQIIFAGLTVIFVGIFLTPRILHRQEDEILSRVMPTAFLALYSVGIMFLVNTAHAGGRLVHEFGIHAVVPDASEPAPTVNHTETAAEHEENR